MSVTLTGGVMIALGLYFYLFAADRLMPAMVFFAPFSGTAVINFSNYGLAPAALFLIFLLLWKITSGEMMRPVNLGRDHMIVIALATAFATLSVLSFLLSWVDRGFIYIQLTQTAYILFGIFLMAVLSVDLARQERLESAILALRAGMVLVALWGIVQAACYYGGVEYPAFIFNNSESHSADLFDQMAGSGLTRIASVAVEPSFMAVSLMLFGSFGATVLAVEPRLRTRAWIGAVGLVLAVVIASTSTTGYLGLVVLAVLLGLRRPSLMLAAVFAGLLTGAVLIVMFPGFGEAVYEFTLGKGSTFSFSERSGTILRALPTFMAHPLLGAGWGIDFSYSLITIMLANMGIIGTSVFVLAYGGTILASRAARWSAEQAGVESTQWRNLAYAQGAENAMMVFFVQSSAAGFHFVVADIWSLWGLSLATISCLVCGRIRVAALSRPRPAMPAMAGAR